MQKFVAPGLWENFTSFPPEYNVSSLQYDLLTLFSSQETRAAAEA